MRESEIYLKLRNKPDDFKICLNEEVFVPQGVSLTALDQIWDSMRKSSEARGKKLWDGTCYRITNLKRLNLREKTMELGIVQYSRVRALIEIGKEVPLDPSDFPLHVNTGALLKTADDYFVFGKKVSDFGLQNQYVEVIGGGLQSSELQVTQGADLGRNILKEMKEEINLDSEPVKELDSLGFIFDGNSMSMIMIFEIKLGITLEEVKRGFETRTEFEFKELVEVKENNLGEFLASQKGYIRLLDRMLR